MLTDGHWQWQHLKEALSSLLIFRDSFPSPQFPIHHTYIRTLRTPISDGAPPPQTNHMKCESQAMETITGFYECNISAST